MGRAPCCDEEGIKKGPWTPEEDEKLLNYIQRNGHGSWRALPKLAGLNRCGKSCRLRWTNYLRPDIKRGDFSDEEEKIIIKLHSHLGNKWSAMATRLPGRTDNEIKNYWNTHLKKKLLQMGIDPVTHKPRTDLNLFASLTHLLAASNSNLINPWDSALMLQADTAHLARIQLLQILLQTMNGSIPPNMEAISPMGSPSFHEYHFNKLLQLNGHSVGLFDGSLGVGHHPSPFHSNFSNSGINQPPYGGYQALEESCLSLEGQQTAVEINELATMPHFDMNKGTSSNNNNQMSISSAIAPTIPHTTLVSSSFELVDVDALQDQANPTEISTHSSTSTAFEAWGEFNLDDQASNYCLDIIDQTSLPSWPKESYSNFQMM